MSNPYVGEIRMFGGNFAPDGWLFCDGSLLPISEYETLYNLIGTTYGGDGQTTFALPDLRSRVPIHQGAGYVMGQQGGVENVTLTVEQLPAHTHALNATPALGSAAVGPTGMLASSATQSYYGSGIPQTAMAATAITPIGGGQLHENRAPFLAVSFIISLFGIFPSQG
jgi:microcystin-dependent protein